MINGQKNGGLKRKLITSTPLLFNLNYVYDALDLKISRTFISSNPAGTLSGI